MVVKLTGCPGCSPESNSKRLGVPYLTGRDCHLLGCLTADERVTNDSLGGFLCSTQYLGAVVP